VFSRFDLAAAAQATPAAVTSLPSGRARARAGVSEAARSGCGEERKERELRVLGGGKTEQETEHRRRRSAANVSVVNRKSKDASFEISLCKL